MDRKLLLGGGLLAAAGAVAVAVVLAGGDGSPARPVPTSVEARDSRFPAGAVKARPGVPVEFTNADGIPHTFTADGGLFDSGTVAPGGRWSYAFSSTGSFPYHCEIHPTMRGVVEVSGSP